MLIFVIGSIGFLFELFCVDELVDRFAFMAPGQLELLVASDVRVRRSIGAAAVLNSHTKIF